MNVGVPKKRANRSAARPNVSLPNAPAWWWLWGRSATGGRFDGAGR
jgi:hypothetical protein